MMRPALAMCALLAVTVATLPVPARAAPMSEQRVRQAMDRASAHVKAGRYEQALAVVDEAEREQQLPVFIYVRALIEERRGDCEAAIRGYRQYLANDVPEQDAAVARAGMERCGEQAPEAAAATSSEGAVATPDGTATSSEGEAASSDEGGAATSDESSSGIVEPPSDDPSPPRRWFGDPWGGALLISGVVGVVAGGVLLIQGRVDQGGSRDATTLSEFERHADRAVTFNRAGLAVTGVGSALLVGAAVRYFVVGVRERRRLAATAALGRHGIGLGVRGRF